MIKMLAVWLLMFGSLQEAPRAQASRNEKALWCEIFTCKSDELTLRVEERKAGEVSYFPFEGGLYRPGRKPDGDLQHLGYDEVWIEWTFADMDFNNKLSARDELADISYTYWKDGRFVVSLTFAAADLSYVPRNLTEKGREPSELEKFLYRRMNGIGPATAMTIRPELRKALGIEEWFVVDSINDRKWFETTVAKLKKQQFH